MGLKVLVGSGERIGLVTLPFLVIGLGLNVLWPSLFSVGGPPMGLKMLSAVVLAGGITVWLWSAVLILTRVTRHELITSGPFAVVKHPLYTGVALLVVPWIGLLFDTWLGILIGIVMYTASRVFAPDEEKTLSSAFGPAWDEYCRGVKVPWL